MQRKLITLSFFFFSLNFLSPVLALFYLDRGAAQSDIFLILLSFSAAVLLAEVPTGVFGDKYGLKLSLVLGSLCRLIGALMLFFADSVLWICLSRAMDGIGAAFFSGALETYLYESLEGEGSEDKLGGLLGKIKSATYIGSIIAFLVGPLILTDFSSTQFDTVAMMWLVACILQFIPILFLPKVSGQTTALDGNNDPTADLVEDISHQEAINLAHLHQVPDPSHLKVAIRNIMASKALVLLFLNFTLVFIPTIVYAKFYQIALADIGVSSFVFGVVAVGVALLGFGLSASTQRLVDRFGNTRLFNASGFVVVAGFAVMVLFPDNFWMALLSIVLVTAPIAIRSPVYSQLRNDLIPSQSRTTTISLLSIGDSLFDFLILGALGLWTNIAFENVMMVCLAISLGGSLIVARRHKYQSA